MFLLSVIFGLAVGFALGLTGGGGSLLAVPLLVYGMSIAPREAIGISLAAVGVTALVGVISRLRLGQVEIGPSLLFAAVGVLGAPLGAWVAALIPETTLLTLFSALMVIVAVHMWQTSARHAREERSSVSTLPQMACQRDHRGALVLTTPCALLLLAAGLATGFLTGMFGVGGGFVIVPALVLLTRMPIRRAVGTSLLVIVLVSISGVASHLLAGRDISLAVTAMFVAGGVVGMTLAGRVAERLPTPVLERVFAGGIALVAAFVAFRTFV